MAEQQQSNWRLQGGHYLGEVSALCFLHLPAHLSSSPFLLAGTGSQLLLYNLEAGSMIESFQVFSGIRVHGIVSSATADLKQRSSSTILEFEIVVFGEKKVKLFSLSIETALGFKGELKVRADLSLLQSLPRFNHWVLDVSFLKESRCLAIGCSSNSVCIWDISKSSVVLEVQSPERCLLYCMRFWGDNLEALRIASGTIYNEIIVWKLVLENDAESLTSALEHGMNLSNTFSDSTQLELQQHKAANISRLVGHEGSIFRIAWSADGSMLVSVSDDRSARIWSISAEQTDSDNCQEAAGPVLYGHNARVWDCCVSGSLIVTASEDCTCRVWGLDGRQAKVIKEHIGRGVWRCLYDPRSSFVLTAGFDSAIKVHQLPVSLPWSLEGESKSKQLTDGLNIISCQTPNSCEHSGLMDSKSEYVRCLHFGSKDTLYVATNHGCLYHANFSQTRNVKWTKIVQVSEEVQIICMDLTSKRLPKQAGGIDDWIALGDGKGNMTVVRVIGDVYTPEVDFTCTWPAEKERQLLGTYWCKASEYSFVFTADPRGTLKLWKLYDPRPSVFHTSARDFKVSLVAEFASSYGIRIKCLDPSFEDQVLICGDIRGNLILFPLSKGVLLDAPNIQERKISPQSCFKGAHGISSVSSITIAKLSFNVIEICSTGADGCICYFEYNLIRKSLEFIGMKQVKELSLIESVSTDANIHDDLANCGYAVGFASTEFIIWNLITEGKVVQIPCGGWRRPHSYYLGDVPEMRNCFAYVKDEIIYIYQQWIPESNRKIFPLNLQVQFHGREVHSLCFVSEDMLVEQNGKHCPVDKSSWIVTGCEDGTVRLTRFTPGVNSFFTSKLLGEHVGGSAVRAICFVSKMYSSDSDVTNLSDWKHGGRASADDKENPVLLISVGAKRVLTSWLLRGRTLKEKEKSLVMEDLNKDGNKYFHYSGVSSSISFKWLSTDMPVKNSHTHGKTKDIGEMKALSENVSNLKADAASRSGLLLKGDAELQNCLDDKYEDDWRYLAVTAFLVKHAGSRLIICFVVVACSDATLALRALILPHRLWFDVALLVPLSSPVLTLQHVIIPAHLLSGDNIQIGNSYLVMSGATDGTIAFWDLTDKIEAFLQQLSTLDAKKLVTSLSRPRTGRGSQGGRWWRSLSGMSRRRSGESSVLPKAGETTNCNSVNQGKSVASGPVSPKAGDKANCYLENHGISGVSAANDAECQTTACLQTVHDNCPGPEVNSVDSSLGMCEIQPIHVLHNVHESGVNCLYVSDIQNFQSSDNDFVFVVVSGGDDQALRCLKLLISPLSTDSRENFGMPDASNSFSESECRDRSIYYSKNLMKNCRIRFLYGDRVPSAHSSSVKGVWTDGNWAFSTGLDQRVRCWRLEEEHCKLVEQTHLIISVPEPEALHVRACGRHQYQIAIAGRGMQMVDFCVEG